MQRHDPINLPLQIPLWPEGVNPLPEPTDLDFPTFTLYLPSQEYRTGQSLLILPGGGYRLTSTAKEGHRPAQWLNSLGIAAAVLEYRHAPRRHPLPLLDAQRGLRLLRQQAGEHGLDEGKVGCMGFSAGGHLAGLLCTSGPDDVPPLDDLRGQIDAQPDFCALIYPVVSMCAPFAHQGSRINLIGDSSPDEQARMLSLENRWKSGSPPLFLIHGQNDNAVPIENSMSLFQAATKAKCQVSAHFFADLPHGIGMADFHPWVECLKAWLTNH